LIADRLGELPDEEQAIVDWLAVAGGPLSETDLLRVHGEQSEEAIARLCARGLCDHNADLVDVRHPLTRDVAYRLLERARKKKMHARLGRYLAQTPLGKGLTAAVVARHLARGGERTPAAELFLEAGAAARANYQTSLATRCYRRAIALLDADDLRLLDAHEAMEAICRNRGRWRERRKHLTRLRQLAKQSRKPLWVATALSATARFEFESGHLAKALNSAQRAEQLATQVESHFVAVEAQALTSEILRDLGDMQGALAAIDRALKTASSSDMSARLRAEVLRSRGTLLRRMGRVHESIEAHAEAIAVFKRVGARRLEARAKSSLSFAMYVLGEFEDGVALALDSIQIDLAIGGRFQIAKTLSNIGQCYAGLGDLERGLAYLKRARDAHERYGDQDSRADTLLATAEVLIEAGDFAKAATLVGDAGALTQVTGSAYDSIHEKILRAVLARAAGDPHTAVMKAFDARQAAEAQAYVAFHFYAMAVEAAARIEVGEEHTGILLATTAMGAIETLQGSEYGLHTRALCSGALRRAGSPQAVEMRRRAANYARRLLASIRDRQFRAMFLNRTPVAEVLSERPAEEQAEE
jgi:tetratricopeptide (TPR) repeat protein